MAFESVKKYAVSSCKGSCYEPGNLCREHAVPGAVVCVGDERKVEMTIDIEELIELSLCEAR